MDSPSDTRAKLIKTIDALQKTRQKLEALEAKQHEPIAIIGMGCRFPGGSDSPEQFWQFLAQGRDAVATMPADRRSAHHNATTIPPCCGGFLPQVDTFDPAFFGISPRETVLMDPQQRLLLEVGWEALENATLVPESLFNSRTGVFIGLCSFDYALLTRGQTIYSPQDELYQLTGMALSVAAGRLAYAFGFTGPAVVVDTACSASLVAVHQACQSLRKQECHLALAGGVNLILNDRWAVSGAGAEDRLHALDGRCKTFDAAANGFGRGEGCGLVVLKRLSDAQTDGDTILAVLRGSMLNQDGRSSGLSAPNGPAQQTVIRQALQQAGLQPDQVDYIEAHGTGTTLGDPIEIGALNAVFAQRTRPLWVGSVKTNLAHLEGAAGIAGLMKVVLSLQHGQIPPHLHFHHPNPYIDWNGSPIQIPVALTPWPHTGTERKKIAGISSFGISGTNAHLVVEESPPVPGVANERERPLQLLTISAKSEAALRAYVQRYQDFLATHPDLKLGDLCYTSHIGRSHFTHRLSIVAHSFTGLQQTLSAYLDQPATLAINQASLSPQPASPKVAFLFTGQGSQYVGMGRELYETDPTFRATLDRCDELLREHLGESILAVLYPETRDGRQETPRPAAPPQSPSATRIDDTTYTQPALFALEYALASLWQSWGIQPDILLGHSVGEVAAACVAGVFSLEDGIKLIAARGRLMGALPQAGAMLAVQASAAHVQPAIAAYRQEVAIAAINGPESIVLSGQREAVLAIAAQLAAEGVKTRPLTVSHAFHSPLMAPMLADFRQVAASITYHKPKLRLVSNLTGNLAGEEITTPDYWVRQVQEPVRFAAGVQTLHEQGIGIFLEIGPKPVLLGMAEEAATGKLPAAAGFLPSLREGQSDWQPMLTSLGELYMQGVAIDWHSFDQDYHRRKVVLPTYPFQRQRYWVETNADQASEQDKGRTPHNGFANWLNSQNLEQLTQRLTDKGHFSSEEQETVAKVLTTLEAESRTQQLTEQIDAMLYEVSWELQNKPLMIVPPATPGRWLILADAGGVGRQLAEQLRALGEQVEWVAATTELTEHSALLSLASEASVPLRGIVHLWSLDTGAIEDVTTLMQQQKQQLGSVLQLVQSIASLKGDAPRLWVVTQGVQQLSPTETSAVARASLWGLGRVIALEHGERWGGLIDLECAAEPMPTAKALVAEILQQQSDHENQVAYWKGARYVARLIPSKAKAPSEKAPPIRSHATYLITGGLGGVGLLVAAWLGKQGAKHLILTGRRGISHKSQQASVNQLQAQGVTVQIAQIDVADESARRQLFAAVAASTTPLKGIFHTAGVLDDGILLNQTWDRFANVLAAKVIGSWLLHQLSKDLDLDMMVFFSSITSLIGNPGQGNYAAANAFLDGLARYRQQQGLPGLSINWGAWADVGMAVRTSQTKVGERAWIRPQVGMQALAQLLAHAGQIAVAPFDWTEITWRYGRPQPFLANFATPPPTTTATPTLVDELTALPAPRRLEHLATYVQQTVGHILAMTNLPDKTTGFADLGMDSLMAMELKRRLERGLGVTLPTTLAFEYPTVDALTGYLLQEVLTLLDVHATPANTLVKLRNTERAETIAVISMACRFPNADTPEAFWQLLQNGVDTVQEIPATRWNVADYYSPQRPQPGKMYTRQAALLAGVDGFDPLFFGIAPREAVGMDPMHRLLLEISWEAIERAGLTQSTLVDSATGVFVGIGASEYGLFNQNQTLTELDSHTATGSGHSIAAGRLAFTLGLQGPTMAVDTACSSSLVALHLACQSLRAGECDLALAGGVSLILSPVGHVVLSQMQALSPDGRCKTFDASADGYGRGEGGGMVVLKRLSDAQAAGDAILAVIQGSAVNHDGPSSGLTVPNKRAQEKLLRQALNNAQVTPDQVGYIEAHGTGTPLGDPLELRALGAVFGAERSQPLLVGSVKTNIGHLEAAAGIAGFIKTVLALQHGQIPAHLHFNTPNPYIEWDEFAIAVPTTLQPWPQPADSAQRIAGISSFGISGTNAHLLVASPPAKRDARVVPAKMPSDAKHSCYLLPLSAKNRAALPALAMRYQEHLQRHPASDLGDLCYTAAIGRNHFNTRLALVATDRADLEDKLAAVQKSAEMTSVSGASAGQTLPRIAFLFTGQGSQYLNMGRELYATEPTFRAVIDRCDVVAQDVLGRSLSELLYPAEKPAHNDLIQSHPCGQAVNFALECALIELWKAWGVQPDFVLGHSLGDFAAAYAAGVFSLEDGLRLVIERGQLMEHAQGSMVAVMAAETTVAPFVEPYDDVAIAVINGPRSVVISGGCEHVATIAEALQIAGIKTKAVAVPMAAHSPLLDPVLDNFERRVRDQVTLHTPQCCVVSSMTGQVVTAELTDPAYWRQHLRNPVRFMDAVKTLALEGCNLLVEIGPKPTLLGLAGPIYDTLNHTHNRPTLLPSLREGQSDWQQILTSLGEVYVQGVAINWQGVYATAKGQKVTLPTYPFQRQRYWLDAPKQQRNDSGLRPLIDQKIKLPLQQQTIFEKTFSAAALPFLADHLLYDQIVVPGACHLSFVLSGAEFTIASGQCTLQDILFHQVLALGAAEERVVQLLFEAKDGFTAFQIISFKEADAATPVTHATGRIHALKPTIPSDLLSTLQARCLEAIEPVQLYDWARRMQVELGPTFRWFKQVWRGNGEALAQLEVPKTLPSISGYPLFPSLIDACFQLGVALRVNRNDAPTAEGEVKTAIPFAIESFSFCRSTNHQDLWCHIKQVAEQKWDIQLLDQQGEVIAAIQGFVLREAPIEVVYKHDAWKEWLYTIEWQITPIPTIQPEPLPMPAALLPPGNMTADQRDMASELNHNAFAQSTIAESQPGGETLLRQHTWLLFADTTGVGAALATQLRNRGEYPILVYRGHKYQQVDRHTFQIDPDSPADYHQLLAAIPEGAGFVHLWSLDITVVHQATELAYASQLGCGTALHLVQALLRTQCKPAGVWLVTQDAQAVNRTDAVQGVAQSGLWGMGRVIELEHPELKPIRVDLDSRIDVKTQAALLCAELTETQLSENQVALRRHQEQTMRYAARLTQENEPTDHTISIHAEATYLITGGLGGIGLEMAKWLVQQGARHLLLVGRSPINPAAQAKIVALVEMGAEVVYHQVDVTVQAQVAQVLAQVNAQHPLRGIIHSVGVLDDGGLLQQSWARFHNVLAPKIVGAWHLHTLTLGTPLDFFVLCSSAAGLLGNRGQANHAAANAFLDAFAWYRHAQGLPALSINWGAWSTVGAAAELVRHKQQAMAERGIGVISPEQGISAFAALLGQDAIQVGVIPIHWPKYLDADTAQRPFLRAFTKRFLPEATQSKRSATTQAHTNLREVLSALSSNARAEQLSRYIRAEIAQVLGIAEMQLIPSQQPLFELGIDSLMALELKNKLEAGLCAPLHSTLIFDYPTIDGLTTYLLTHLFEQTNGSHLQPMPTPSAERSGELSAELSAKITYIAQIADDEAEALLLEKLNN